MRSPASTAPLRPAPFPIVGETRLQQRVAYPGTIALILLVLASLVLLRLNVEHGIGIYPDTTRYMGIAPEPYDAPIYHWMLTVPAAFGIPMLTAAMAWAVAMLCANVTLIFALLRRCCANWKPAGVGTALIVFSPQFVTLHAVAMSEAPFVAFLLLTVWFALNYFESGERRQLLIASVLLAMATLTRFTAPPLGLSIALVALTNPRFPLARRIMDCVVLALPGVAIFFAWVGISTLTVGHSIGRELHFYGNMGATEWYANLKTLASWIMPDKVSLLIRLPFVALVAAFASWQTARMVAAWRGRANDEQPGLATAMGLILALFFVGYLAFVWLSTALEANLSLVGRYGFPAYLSLVMLTTVQLSRLDSGNATVKTVRVALLATAAIVLASHAVRTTARTYQTWAEGAGYHARIWRESPTMEVVRELPRDAVIYSNAADAIALLTGRTTRMGPRERELRTDLPEPGNPVSLQYARIRAEAATGAHPVYIVVFDNILYRFYLADEAHLNAALPLQAAARLGDGRVYRVAPHSARVRP